MERQRKPASNEKDPLDPAAEEQVDIEPGEHAPSRARPGEDLSEISEEDD